MPEKIKLSGSDPSPIQPGSPGPGPSPDPGPNPSGSAPITLQGTVSEQDAINASGHTKINTISGFSPTGGGSVQTGQSVSVGGLIDGKLAVEMMDATLPSLMLFVLYKVGMKVRKSELQLTEKEKSVLAPIVTKCLETLMINFQNPWMALLATLSAFYGAKLLPAIAVAIDEKQKDKQAAILKDKEKKNEPAASEMLPKAEIKTNLPPWEPTDQMVTDKARKDKISKKKAVEVLKALHKLGKI